MNKIDLRFIWRECQGDYDLMQRRIDRTLYDADKRIKELEAALRIAMESFERIFTDDGSYQSNGGHLREVMAIAANATNKIDTLLAEDK